MQSLAVQEVPKTHIVKKGEIISKVAKKYGCTPEDIISWNHLRSAKLKPGQKLTVYLSVKNPSPSVQTSKINPEVSKTNSPAKASADSTKVSVSAGGKIKYYTVQKGDSLWNIAQINGVTVDQIKQWNNIDSAHKIVPGQKIKILIAG
jgi:membrane-bound lytic murein transglycosylase D